MEETNKYQSALQEKDGINRPNPLNINKLKALKAKSKVAIDSSALAQQVIDGNRVALSQAITIIESTATKHQEIAKNIIQKCLEASKPSIRIGITGVPGVGKSTFIESFGKLLTSKGHKVAVLAVTPVVLLLKGAFWEIKLGWKL